MREFCQISVCVQTNTHVLVYHSPFTQSLNKINRLGFKYIDLLLLKNPHQSSTVVARQIPLTNLHQTPKCLLWKEKKEKDLIKHTLNISGKHTVSVNAIYSDWLPVWVTTYRRATFIT